MVISVSPERLITGAWVSTTFTATFLEICFFFLDGTILMSYFPSFVTSTFPSISIFVLLSFFPSTFFLIVSLISASSSVLPYSTTKVSGHDTARLFSLTDLMINIITSTIRTVTEPAIKYLTHLLFIKHTNFLI